MTPDIQRMIILSKDAGACAFCEVHYIPVIKELLQVIDTLDMALQNTMISPEKYRDEYDSARDLASQYINMMDEVKNG